MTITDQKKDLRQRMRSRRASLPNSAKAEYDQWICQALWDGIEQYQYRKIHLYLPMLAEINIRPLISKLLGHGLTVVAPRALPQGKFQNLVLQALGKVEKGIFGTTYPAGEQVFSDTYDLIIVPGLAFDRQRYRLGYGGGYYDNFMINHPGARKVGLAYPFQVVDKVPTEPHDLRLDEILFNPDFLSLS